MILSDTVWDVVQKQLMLIHVQIGVILEQITEKIHGFPFNNLLILYSTSISVESRNFVSHPMLQSGHMKKLSSPIPFL